MSSPSQPFPKGIATNPGGRPRKTPEMLECERILREGTPACARRILEIVNGADDGKALAAADVALRRVFGNPAQAITGADGGPIEHVALDVTKMATDDLATLVDIASRAPVESGDDSGGEG